METDTAWSVIPQPTIQVLNSTGGPAVKGYGVFTV
jgi:hypothetical protein